MERWVVQEWSVETESGVQGGLVEGGEGLAEGREGLVAGGLRLEDARLHLGVQGLGKAWEGGARPLQVVRPTGGALDRVRQK